MIHYRHFKCVVLSSQQSDTQRYSVYCDRRSVWLTDRLIDCLTNGCGSLLTFHLNVDDLNGPLRSYWLKLVTLLFLCTQYKYLSSPVFSSCKEYSEWLCDCVRGIRITVFSVCRAPDDETCLLVSTPNKALSQSFENLLDDNNFGLVHVRNWILKNTKWMQRCWHVFHFVFFWRSVVVSKFFPKKSRL